MKEASLIRKLVAALLAAESHLEYCGYGDSWERECARESKLAEQIESALKSATRAVGRNLIDTSGPK